MAETVFRKSANVLAQLPWIIDDRRREEREREREQKPSVVVRLSTGGGVSAFADNRLAPHWTGFFSIVDGFSFLFVRRSRRKHVYAKSRKNNVYATYRNREQIRLQ